MRALQFLYFVARYPPLSFTRIDSQSDIFKVFSEQFYSERFYFVCRPNCKIIVVVSMICWVLFEESENKLESERSE